MKSSHVIFSGFLQKENEFAVIWKKKDILVAQLLKRHNKTYSVLVRLALWVCDLYLEEPCTWSNALLSVL